LVKLTKNLDSGRGDGFSVGVPGVAGVHARVLRVNAQQVQGNIVEVIGRTETMSYTIQIIIFFIYDLKQILIFCVMFIIKDVCAYKSTKKKYFKVEINYFCNPAKGI